MSFGQNLLFLRKMRNNMTQEEPFRLIQNAYKLLMTHMDINGIRHKDGKNIIPCFEKSYKSEGRRFMDVYIAIE